jgi:hypothetical protein
VQLNTVPSSSSSQKEYSKLTKLSACNANSPGNSLKKSLLNLGSIFLLTTNASGNFNSDTNPLKNAYLDPGGRCLNALIRESGDTVWSVTELEGSGSVVIAGDGVGEGEGGSVFIERRR